MTSITINSHTLVHRSQTIIASDVGKELVMIDIDAGKYYGFNAVGTRIWHLIENPCSVQTICDRLLKEFEIEFLECEREVLKFIDRLLELKIVDIFNVPEEGDISVKEV